jgi:hypothetical protein
MKKSKSTKKPRKPSTIVEDFVATGGLTGGLTKPVQCITTVYSGWIEYRVILGDALSGNYVPHWSKYVNFGTIEANRPGGAAFREAAREQEQQALRLIRDLKETLNV